MTWGFPCTDISIAGKQKGFKDEKGNLTRSGLYYEGLRILKAKKPKYSIIENVKALTQKKFKEQFKLILADIEQEGYNSYWQILNAKNYGVPQNRERVFVVNIRKDIDTQTFEFPQSFGNKALLKNILEFEIDDKYYLSQKMIDCLIRHKEKQVAKGNTFGFNPIDRDSEYVRSFKANYWKVQGDADFIKEKYYLSEKGINYVLNEDRLKKQITQVNGDTALCLTAKGNSNWTGTFICDNEHYKLRKLTPLECFRLMGFDDYDCQVLIDNKISDTQLYKMAGNSIVVNVLEAIFKNLFTTGN